MVSFLSLSEQQADLCSFRAATVPLKALSVNTAKALDALALRNISWEVCFGFSFLCVLPAPQECACPGKHHHQIQGHRHVLPALLVAFTCTIKRVQRV